MKSKVKENTFQSAKYLVGLQQKQQKSQEKRTSSKMVAADKNNNLPQYQFQKKKNKKELQKQSINRKPTQKANKKPLATKQKLTSVSISSPACKSQHSNKFFFRTKLL